MELDYWDDGGRKSGYCVYWTYSLYEKFLAILGGLSQYFGYNSELNRFAQDHFEGIAD